MKLVKTAKVRGRFQFLTASREAQAAIMTLQPGDASDESPSNEHPRCEQWLFVISGHGEAIVGKAKRRMRRVLLKPNFLLLIEKQERHQIKNTSHETLKTINLYAPPAYKANGKPKRRASTAK